MSRSYREMFMYLIHLLSKKNNSQFNCYKLFKKPISKKLFFITIYYYISSILSYLL